MNILELAEKGTAEQIIKYARERAKAEYDDLVSVTAYELGFLKSILKDVVAARDRRTTWTD